MKGVRVYFNKKIHSNKNIYFIEKNYYNERIYSEKNGWFNKKFKFELFITCKKQVITKSFEMWYEGMNLKSK